MKNPDLIIVAGQSRTLDILLTIRLREQVTVQSERNRVSTGPENSASQIVLSGSDLDMLSDDSDQLAADLQALVGPGDGPNLSQLTVDGFSGGKLPSKASIREIRINANPLAAEQDFFGFGRIDIFTKPGSNKFVGQAFMTFNDESLNGRNPFAQIAPRLRRAFMEAVSAARCTQANPLSLLISIAARSQRMQWSRQRFSIRCSMSRLSTRLW
jgi:hypothetical protein